MAATLPADRPHAVLVPVPAQGHVSPMLKLAKLLHYRRGFHITFVNTDYNHRRLLKSLGPKALHGLPSFRFASIADGVPPSAGDGDTTQDARLFCESLLNESPLPHFRDLVSELNSSPDVPPITCIVSDSLMTFTLKVSQELGIPNLLLSTPSACGSLSFCYFHKLIQKGLVPLKDESCLTNGYLDTVIDFIPAMEGVTLKDLPTFIRTTKPDDIMVRFFISVSENALKGSAIALNTFESLERKVLDALFPICPPMYVIGPLDLLEDQVSGNYPDELKSIRLNLLKEDSECLSWLDSREPNSVIYLNFGSVARLTYQQLIECAWGLANSKQNFLWVIRHDLVIGESAKLPPELEAEIKDRGLISSWCDQKQVLGHPAIRGFLSHCGWNSTIESICSGVPMICWPAVSEQPINSWFVCREWDVGMEISDLRREEVERVVREMMVGEKGKEMKKKAMEWKKLAQEACAAPDGSSYKNFDCMVDQVLLSKFGNP